LEVASLVRYLARAPQGTCATDFGWPRQETSSMERQNTIGGRLGLICAATCATALFALAPASAQAQTTCLFGEGSTVCGTVWNDADNDGFWDGNETPISGVQVFFDDGSESTYTDAAGHWEYFLPPGTHEIYIDTSMVGTGTVASPADVGGNDAFDSDGVDDEKGKSIAVVVVDTDVMSHTTADFGFYTPAKVQPGTGTPGYWKNHSSAWPVSSITIGGQVYSKATAIAWLGKLSKDKTTTIFASLVSAKLNVKIGNDDSCIATTIDAADDWMAAHAVGSGVAASSADWALAEPLHKLMDSYNNGLECAPHRN
jgi:hypothetical protein